METRSDEEIIEEILKQLRPLKDGVTEEQARAAIRATIEKQRQRIKEAF
jgi:hypothetical protein